jgi:hypothetical protein
LVLDTESNLHNRMFVAKLFSGRLGRATKFWSALTDAARQSDGTALKARVLKLCSDETRIGQPELELFQDVIQRGTLEEQMTAVDGLAFVCCRPARRRLINVAEDTGAPLDLRERALEMLHLRPSRRRK